MNSVHQGRNACLLASVFLLAACGQATPDRAPIPGPPQGHARPSASPIAVQTGKPAPAATGTARLGADPAWCAPIIAYFKDANATGATGTVTYNAKTLAKTATAGKKASAAALIPGLPALVVGFLNDTASLDARVVATSGHLTSADNALGQTALAGLVTAVNALKSGCPKAAAAPGG